MRLPKLWPTSHDLAPGLAPLLALAILAGLTPPVTEAGQDLFRPLVEAATTLRDAGVDGEADGIQKEQERQSRRWLSALTAQEMPDFHSWNSEGRTFATAASAAEDYPFPGVPPGASADAIAAHGSAGGPLIHFTHFNAAAYRHIRESGLYQHSTLRAMAARDAALPAPPPDAMVALTGWWPLAAAQPTPMPLWDAGAPMRSDGANGYLNWPRIGLVAPADKGSVQDSRSVQQFAGRSISDRRVLSREAFFRVTPSAEHVQALMDNPQFRSASTIALGRPMRAGDELALVAFHLLHFGLEEGLWLTYWWDVEQAERQETAAGTPGDEPMPLPWRNYRGDMTFSPVDPREADGSPNICFNPWFDAVFPDSGQGNGLKANCLSCHLRAGIPAAGRLKVTRGRPDLEGEDSDIIYTQLLWSLANPRRNGSGEQPR